MTSQRWGSFSARANAHSAAPAKWAKVSDRQVARVAVHRIGAQRLYMGHVPQHADDTRTGTFTPRHRVNRSAGKGVSVLSKREREK